MAVSPVRRRDYWWAALGVLVAILAAENTVVAVYEVGTLTLDARFGRALLFLVGLPVSWIAAYWWVMGAWRRTAWGSPTAEQRMAASTPLTVRQNVWLTRFTRAGIGCVLLLLVAFAVQLAIA
jgi:hypothetical protein